MIQMCRQVTQQSSELRQLLTSKPACTRAKRSAAAAPRVAGEWCSMKKPIGPQGPVGSSRRKPKHVPPPQVDILRRVWRYIDITGSGCWLWTGPTNRDGYAHNLAINGDRYLPHRLMFSWFKWDIPPGLTIDHVCKQKTCMNPDHMEPVTGGENVRRALKVAYCKRGHAQTPENRYRYGKSKKKERCKPCIPIQTAEWKGRRVRNT